MYWHKDWAIIVKNNLCQDLIKAYVIDLIETHLKVRFFWWTQKAADKQAGSNQQAAIRQAGSRQTRHPSFLQDFFFIFSFIFYFSFPIFRLNYKSWSQYCLLWKDESKQLLPPVLHIVIIHFVKNPLKLFVGNFFSNFEFSFEKTLSK